MVERFPERAARNKTSRQAATNPLESSASFSPPATTLAHPMLNSNSLPNPRRLEPAWPSFGRVKDMQACCQAARNDCPDKKTSN
jgi:hypothetical protein